MAWFRVDNRLVHGQVIEGWLPYLDARVLIVINDALAVDELQQQIMQLAIPARIQVRFMSVANAQNICGDPVLQAADSMFLFANCQDVVRFVEQGGCVPLLNIGNMHYSSGKRQLCAHVAVSEDDQACFTFLQARGIQLDFRCVPGDDPILEEW